MQQRSAARLIACLALAWSHCPGEVVTLRNGFQLDAERLERDAATLRLLMPNGGWVAVDRSEVARIEPAAPSGSEDRPRPSAPPPEPAPALQGEIERSAAEAGVPAALVRAVAWAESGLRQEAVSPKGAIGVMQLMPETAAELGVNPLVPSGNVLGGALYLKRMLDRFDGDSQQLVKALAAYNAGPARVAEHSGVPPYRETHAYIGRVIRRFLELEGAEAAEGGEAVSKHGEH